MRKFAFLLISLIMLASCRQDNVAEKPENLIEEDRMENMLYDLALLQSVYSVSSYDLQSKRIDGQAFLKEKYSVDSTTFAKSHKYYASQPEKYQKMQLRVKERLEAEKKKLEKVKPMTEAEKQLEKSRPTP